MSITRHQRPNFDKKFQKEGTKTTTPEDKRSLNKTEEVNEATERHNNEKWNQFLEEFNPNRPGLWNIQGALKTERNPIPPFHGENGIVHTPEDKTRTIA